MGRKSRSTQQRTHRHTDYAQEISFLNEGELLDRISESDKPAFLLILDSVQDPHNLGACLRSADGAGVHAVVIPKDRAVPVNDTVRRIACGAAEQVPIAIVTNLARVLDQLKEAGVWIYGTSDQAESVIYDQDLIGPLALVLGAEGEGIRRLTAEKCDFLVKLPMAGSVESLNVSVAAGVAMYEVVRQRRAKQNE